MNSSYFFVHSLYWVVESDEYGFCIILCDDPDRVRLFAAFITLHAGPNRYGWLTVIHTINMYMGS